MLQTLFQVVAMSLSYDELILGKLRILKVARFKKLHEEICKSGVEIPKATLSRHLESLCGRGKVICRRTKRLSLYALPESMDKLNSRFNKEIARRYNVPCEIVEIIQEIVDKWSRGNEYCHRLLTLEDLVSRITPLINSKSAKKEREYVKLAKKEREYVNTIIGEVAVEYGWIKPSKFLIEHSKRLVEVLKYWCEQIPPYISHNIFMGILLDLGVLGNVTCRSTTPPKDPKLPSESMRRGFQLLQQHLPSIFGDWKILKRKSTEILNIIYTFIREVMEDVEQSINLPTYWRNGIPALPTMEYIDPEAIARIIFLNNVLGIKYGFRCESRSINDVCYYVFILNGTEAINIKADTVKTLFKSEEEAISNIRSMLERLEAKNVEKIKKLLNELKEEISSFRNKLVNISEVIDSGGFLKGECEECRNIRRYGEYLNPYKLNYT